MNTTLTTTGSITHPDARKNVNTNTDDDKDTASKNDDKKLGQDKAGNEGK